jgi:hypothetical protein
MFGRYNGFVSKARVSACMYFLVHYEISKPLIKRHRPHRVCSQTTRNFIAVLHSLVIQSVQVIILKVSTLVEVKYEFKIENSGRNDKERWFDSSWKRM